VTSTVDAAPVDVPVEPAGDRPAGRPGHPRRTLVLGALGMLLWAIVCTAVLETPLWWDDLGPLAVAAVFSKPLDIVFVLLVLLLLWCLSGRLWTSMGVLLGLTGTLSAVNASKMRILAETLFPSDHQFLSSPGFLLEMVSIRSVVGAGVGLVLLAVATLWASRIADRRHPRLRRSDHPRGWAVLVGVRTVGGVLLVLALSSALHFHEPGNPWRSLYEANGAIWKPYSQSKNYRSNGFVGGVLDNIPGEPMPVPPGYGPDTMRRIADKYAERAEVRNAARSAAGLEDVNVVLVLSEAFADLSRLDRVDISRDTMPLTREVMAGAWGGSTLTNMYGTGTSGMEFEALTGQALGLFNPQVVAPYQNFMSDMETYPSAVGWFAAHGHVPVAVHPYHREFYRRSTVYPMLGFTRFVHDTELGEQERIERSKYISDASAFHEVERQIRDHDEPLLVNLVTMQNHVPIVDWYDDPVPVETPGGRRAVDAIGGYARGQELTDRALHDFLGAVRAGGEPTVVVFYGDHYPAVLPSEVLDANPGLGHLTTPMFIWSSEGQRPRVLPVTSPMTFLPLVFDLVGQPLPPYYELLTEVSEQIGAIGVGRIVSPDGTELTEADLTPQQQELLNDYRLVQYDFSIGQRHAVAEMFYDLEGR